MSTEQIKTILKDRLSFIMVVVLVVFNIALFILWRQLIQTNELPIYSPIRIFPVQFSLLISGINIILALAVDTKSIRTCHLLLSSAIFVCLLSIIMVIYSYNFFKI